MLVCVLLAKFAGLRSDALSTLRPAIGRLQVYCLHISFALPWPPFITELAKWIRRFLPPDVSLMASPECVTGPLAPSTKLMMSTWTPFAFILPFLVLARRAPRTKERFRYLSVAYNILSVFFESCATSIFAPFACKDAELCEGGSIAVNRWHAYVAAFIYVALPMLGVMRLLRFARRHENGGAVHAEIYGAMGLGKYDQHVRAA